MSLAGWLGIGAALVAGLVTLVRVILKRGPDDLGVVSDSWIASHRADPPRD